MCEAPPRMQVPTHLTSRPAQAPGSCRSSRCCHCVQAEGGTGVIQEVCLVIRQDLSWLGPLRSSNNYGAASGGYSLPSRCFVSSLPFVPIRSLICVLFQRSLLLSWTFSISYCAHPVYPRAYTCENRCVLLSHN